MSRITKCLKISEYYQIDKGYLENVFLLTGAGKELFLFCRARLEDKDLTEKEALLEKM